MRVILILSFLVSTPAHAVLLDAAVLACGRHVTIAVACTTIAGGALVVSEIYSGNIGTCHAATERANTHLDLCQQWKGDLQRLRRYQKADLPDEAIREQVNVTSAQVTNAIASYPRVRARLRGNCDTEEKKQALEVGTRRVEACMREALMELRQIQANGN